MIRAILLDLDGTLLDLDLRAFLDRYFAALDLASAPLAARASDPASFMRSLHDAVGAMMQPHPGAVNRDVFYRHLLEHTGIDLAFEWQVYERFYAEVFPTLRDTAKPAAGARRVVTVAAELGLKTAVATNPIFPRIAIDHRIAWAGLDDLAFGAVTSYEEMAACKPHADYFRQTADMLDVAPEDCIMVGDDRVLDMSAADVGMGTYYVGDDADAPADMRGSLDELADLLPRLV
ncbi:MAG: HAD family phosphatase [Actinobacteria bacterium]|nr:HAD family phosphatase [Actinomycetota bacterium]